MASAAATRSPKALGELGHESTVTREVSGRGAVQCGTEGGSPGFEGTFSSGSRTVARR
jgi:hypothetical protein